MAENLTATLEGRTKGEIFTSFDVDAFEVPHGRDEIWRFTPLKRLRGLHDGSAPATGSALIHVTQRPDVTVETVRRGDERLGRAGVPADRVAAQAFSSFNSATIVTVDRDTQVSEPVEIAITGPGEGATAYGHLQVRVGELAEAVVVIDQQGSGTYADNIEFVVGDSARLTVVSIADWADDAVNVSSHHAVVGKDAVLRHVAVTLGGDLVRLTARARFDAPGGDAELLGLYFADDGQHFESRLLVVRRDSGTLEHRTFRDLPDLLSPGDLVVLNDTKVLPARVVGRVVPGGVGQLDPRVAGQVGGARDEAGEVVEHRAETTVAGMLDAGITR